MRYIALAETCLTEGFAALGFEVYPDAEAEDLEKLLCSLLTRKEKALIFTAASLAARCKGRCYREARDESGHILFVELPPPHNPDAYKPAVDALVKRVLGAAALEE